MVNRGGKPPLIRYFIRVLFIPNDTKKLLL